MCFVSVFIAFIVVVGEPHRIAYLFAACVPYLSTWGGMLATFMCLFCFQFMSVRVCGSGTFVLTRGNS